MAYPTGMLSLTLESVDRLAVSVKSFCENRISLLAAGSVSSETILDIYGRLKNAYTMLGNVASVGGIGAYAQLQKNDGGLDIVAEFTALRAAIGVAANGIVSAFPVSAGGYLEAVTLTTEDVIPQQRMFAPASTSGIRTNLQAIVDAID